jgi:hypothetical protein
MNIVLFQISFMYCLGKQYPVSESFVPAEVAVVGLHILHAQVEQNICKMFLETKFPFFNSIKDFISSCVALHTLKQQQNII